MDSSGRQRGEGSHRGRREEKQRPVLYRDAQRCAGGIRQGLRPAHGDAQGRLYQLRGNGGVSGVQTLAEYFPRRQRARHRTTHRRRGVHAHDAVYLRLPATSIHRHDAGHGGRYPRREHHLRTATSQRHHHRLEAGHQLRGHRSAAKRLGRLSADPDGGNSDRAH